VLLFLDLELTFTPFDVDCQLDCFEIRSRTGILLQSTTQRTCHSACKVRPNVLGHLLGRTFVPPLPTVRTPKPALVDKLKGTGLGILGVDHLARLIGVGGLRA
jgi:hypothetical protein